jgi:hypothetical protein
MADHPAAGIIGAARSTNLIDQRTTCDVVFVARAVADWQGEWPSFVSETPRRRQPQWALI